MFIRKTCTPLLQFPKAAAACDRR